jgi:LmbE family N-acetylglucosaminyl deacetylase
LKVEAGHDIHIVYITDGAHSHVHSLGIHLEPTPEELHIIRRREAQAACGVLGVKKQNLIFMDFSSELLPLEEFRAVGELAAVVNKLRPHEIYYPDRTDEHTTHRMVSRITEGALETTGSNAERYRYMVWTECGNNEVNGSNYVQVDISRALPLKKEAIYSYKNQTAVFSPRQRRPLLSRSFIDRFLGGYELFLLHKQRE